MVNEVQLVYKRSFKSDDNEDDKLEFEKNDSS